MAAPLMSSVDGPLGFFDLGGLFVAANGHQSNDTTTLCYDGFGIGPHTAFSSGCSATLSIAAANSYLDACLDSVNKSDLRGVFALMRFNPHTKAFTVAADPLSEYPIFICGLGETLIVSNNSYLIQHAVNAIGLKLTRSSKAAATYCAQGVGRRNRTGYREVALLPPGQLITGIGPNWRLVSSAKLPELDVISYDALLNLASKRLCESLATIVKAGRDQNIELCLDGGLHSRTLLSAAVASKISNLKLSHTSLRPGDHEIARRLASKVGAELISSAHENGGATTDAIDTARKAVFRSQGLPNFPLVPPKLSRQKNVFRIKAARHIGCTKQTPSKNPKGLFWSNPLAAMRKFSSNDPIYSACLTAYSGALTNQQRKTAAKWAYQICSLGGPMQSLFQKPFLRDITNAVIDEIAASSSTTEPVDPDATNADKFRRERGLQMRQENLACGVFCPFADPVFSNFFEIAKRIGKTEWEFLIDLNQKLAGSEVLKIPFAVDVLNGSAGDYLASLLKINKKKLIRASTDISEFGANIDLDEAIASAPYLAEATQVVPDLRALAAALPASHECWQYFRRDKLLTALKERSFILKNQEGPTLVLQLLSTFIWAASAEDKTGIETLA